MPTAFDVIGVLSFVQGAITVIVAGVLAFRAATEQVNSTTTERHNLVLIYVYAPGARKQTGYR
jgi:hypothetical protein